MKNWKYLIGGILLIAIIFFLVDKCSQKEDIIDVPVKIDVSVPSVEGKSDTIYLPSPVKTIEVESPINKELEEKVQKLQKENKELLSKYQEADSISKEKIYKDAISIREYEQKFVDSFQTITVYSKTRGELLSQNLEYETKEYTIPLDTTVQTTVKQKFKVFGLLEAGTPILDPTNNNIIVKGTVILKNSKDNGFSISIDSKGTAWGGYLFKF